MAVLRRGTKEMTPEVRITDATGRSRLMQAIRIPFRFGAARRPALLVVAMDITDRKRAEDTARLNEARLEALVGLNTMVNASLQDISSFAMEEAVRLTQSTVGYIAFANADETVLTMYAWSRSAMAECAIDDKPIEYQVAATGLWGEAVRQRRPIITNDYAAPCQWRRGIPVGHVALTRHMNVPVFDDGRIVIVAGVGNKATEYDDSDVRQLTLLMTEMWRIVQRQRAEAALRAKTEEQDRFFGVARDLLCIADTSGVLHRVNLAWERTLGFAREELEGHSFMDLVHPDDREGTLAAVGCLGAAEDVLDFINRYRCKDGSYRHLEWRSTPVGSLIYAAARDVTERERSAEALRTSEQMLRSVLDHFPGVVFWKDRESVYQGCNRAFSRGAGVGEPDMIVGLTDLDLPWAHTEAAGYRTDDREVMDSGRPKLGIVEPQLQADGRTVWFNTNKVPLFAADGSVVGVLGASLDITEMRRLEEQYRQAQKMEAVGQLAGGVAHDFNNLLQIITGYLELAMHRLPPAHAALHELHEVERATARASTLVRQLLTFSRRDTMRTEVVDLDQLIANLTKMLRRMIEEHIELRTTSHPELPRIVADPGHIEQVIVNLCVNARDAMPEGGTLLIETSLATIDADAAARAPGAVAGQYVVLSVSDSGTGMPPEVVERIFEPFFTTKEVGKGTGLGLATVYGIVHQHGGFVEVTSEPGRGSTFRVYLPAGAGEQQGGIEPQIHTWNAPRGDETVLLAEDDDQVRSFASRILRDAGYTVLVARDGEEALEILARSGHEVDLLVLDSVMPKKGGRGVYDAFRAIHPDTRVLFCTGYSSDPFAGVGSSGERPPVLLKPFTPQALLQQVRAALDGQ
jgi:two-component system cell cycle sensor histidine kinase/response regulator CckA